MANAPKLSGTEKAAIFLLSLEEDVATEILKNLSEEEVEAIGAEMAKIEMIAPEVREQVLVEFSKVSGARSATFYNNEEHVRDMLMSSLGKDRGEIICAKVFANPSREAFSSLRKIDPITLATFLGSEHPQTIALVLSHFEPDHSGQILSNLPDKVRPEVVLRMANMDRITPEVVQEIEQALEREITTIGSADVQHIGGVQPVAEMLNQMERSIEGAILEKVEETNPALVEEIRQLMFVFDDLLQVSDRDIQQILKEVGKEDLALSLKTASDETKEKIFRNLSQRAADMLRDDLEAMGPVRLRDVEVAQGNVVKVARRLEEEGTISLGREAGGEVIV